jgi:hypothetical protein
VLVIGCLDYQEYLGCLDYQEYLDLFITRSEASRPIMVGYPYTSHQFEYNEPKVQFSNMLLSSYRKQGSPMQTIHGDVRPPRRTKGVACEMGPLTPMFLGAARHPRRTLECSSEPREAIVSFALKEKLWQL